MLLNRFPIGVHANTKPSNKDNLKHTYDMLYLCTCALNGDTARISLVTNMDLPKVFACCCEHSVEAMAYEAIEKLLKENSFENSEFPQRFLNNSLLNEWRGRRDASVRKVILLDAMRNSLYKFMDQIGAWHVSLKGIVLKDLYPKCGMRQMADNDVFFDENFREQVRDWFVSQGFTVQLYGVANEDVYLKPPFYNFEMHAQLFDGDRHGELQRYFENHRGDFTRNEDFYLYLVTHEYMHYSSCGTGIRSLTDRYVYLAKHNLDFSYVQTEAKKIGIAEFELASRLLVQKVFGNGFNSSTLNAQERKMLEYYLLSGTYGTEERGVENALNKQVLSIGSKKAAKIAFAVGRVFPPRQRMAVWCELYAPALRSHWLLPLAYLWRILRPFISQESSTKTKNEIRNIIKH
ncbi:MAG: nucleotidyltransferase family protein [Bacteroidales bacterium]|nr:nucleotidyltransferase family protein [Bacteroidales bacterium]